MYTYEFNPSNPLEVLRVERLSENCVVRTHHGYAEQVCVDETPDARTYYHGVIALDDGTYTKDTANCKPIVVDGIAYTPDGNGEVIIPIPSSPPLTGEQIIMLALADVMAELTQLKGAANHG